MFIKGRAKGDNTPPGYFVPPPPVEVIGVKILMIYLFMINCIDYKNQFLIVEIAVIAPSYTIF